MTIKAKLIAVAVLAVCFFVAGLVVEHWRLSDVHAAELSKRDQRALEAAESAKQASHTANAAIAAADKRAWEGIGRDKQELDRLRSCVAAGTCGVRIIAAAADNGPDVSGTGGVGNDAIALGPDVQRRVLDHREAVSEDERKIEYLRRYAEICFKAINDRNLP